MTDQPGARQAATVLGEHRFVSLTTFRRTGVAVSTPVWIARDGDALVVVTPADSGKVKRLRNDPRVQLRPCSRTGTVAPGTQPVDGVAEMVADETTAARLTDLVRAKYGLEYRVTMLIERVAARRQKPRVLLRISLDG